MAYALSTRELFDFSLLLMKAVAADPLAAQSLTERNAQRLEGPGITAASRSVISNAAIASLAI
jgi:hypothetical protein